MGSVPQNKLFEPLQVGPNTLSNRLVMAPLTRFRAEDNHVPMSMVKEYYAQRACVPGTLLITEATIIAPPAGGYPNVPAIFSDEQIAAWKEIADAVHAKGSFLWLQLWALGRVASEEFMKASGNGDLVSSSDVPAGEGAPAPRPLTEEEIQQYVKNYAQAASNAVKRAGLDGVEIHAANGYLIDQFTQDTANKRTDKYGGSVENRSRFALEVAKALTAKDALGAHAEAELGIDPDDISSPWHAAWASMLSFTIGALLPLLTMTLGAPDLRLWLTVLAVVARVAPDAERVLQAAP